MNVGGSSLELQARVYIVMGMASELWLISNFLSTEKLPLQKILFELLNEERVL